MSDPRKHMSEEFEALVTDRFSFLLSDFGYKQKGTRFPNLELSHGDRCAVCFGNAHAGICVEVSLDFEIYSVDVILLKSPDGSHVEHSVWGQSGHAPAILLSALVDRKASSDRKDELLPPSLPSLSWREKKRRFKQRQEAITDRLGDVVQETASRLAESASDVLLGDTSSFPDIQAFYREQQNATLSADGRRVELRF